MADLVPGVSTFYTRDSDVGADSPNNRCLLFGLVAPGALAGLNTPFAATSQAFVDAQTGGAWTHASRLYRAARAQREDAEIWIVPLPDPAGTAATRLLKFAGVPTYDVSNGWTISSATTAAQASDCYIDVAGQVVNFSFAASATWAQIAAAAQAALAAVPDLVVTPSVNSDTVTLTDRHAAALGDDLPVRVWFTNPACGVAVIAGTLTMATTATGAGTLALTDGIQTASVAVANNDTIASRATALRDQVNIVGPVRAAVANPATGVLTLYHRDDRWVRRLSASITAAIGMTATLAAGTAGAGVPTLSGANGPLAQVAKDIAFKVYVQPFADVTSLGASATHLIAQDAAPIEKGQVLFTAISSALPASSLIAATTPALSTTELTCVLHHQGSCVRAGEIAARVGAEVSAEVDHGRNYNGLRLRSTDVMPLAVPPREDRSGRDTWQAGIAAGYAPVAVDAGNRAYVVSARNTFAAASAVTKKLQKWSGALIPIYFRASLRQRLGALFFTPGDGKSIKAKGQPRTRRAVTAKGVRSEILALIKEWDALDLFDYSDDIDAAVRVIVDLSTPGAIAAYVPFRATVDFDRLNIYAAPA